MTSMEYVQKSLLEGKFYVRSKFSCVCTHTCTP